MIVRQGVRQVARQDKRQSVRQVARQDIQQDKRQVSRLEGVISAGLGRIAGLETLTGWRSDRRMCA